MTTSGARGATGARKVVQWRTSTRPEMPAEAKRVPERVTADGRETPGAAGRDADELETGPAGELAEQAEDVARRPGAGLDER